MNGTFVKPRSIARRVYSLLMMPYARRRVRLARTVCVGGLVLDVSPTVFDPTLYHSSLYFAELLSAMPLANRTVLEVGCGSGILALTAGRGGAKVTGVDLNPEAVECTMSNSRRNGLNVETFRSDVFAGLAGRRFDLVISNPPFFRGTPSGLDDLAWRAGEDLQFFRSLFQDLAEHLEPQGRMLMVLSEDAEIKVLESIAGEYALSYTILEHRSIWFERFLLIAVRPK